MPTFELHEGKWKCPGCFMVYPLPSVKAPRHNCGAIPVEATAPSLPHPPSKLEREGTKSAVDKLGIKPEHIKHYIKALARWARKGFPTRTQEQVDITIALCESCEHYTGGRCAKCGCCASRGYVAVLNKAKMATEHCPLKGPKQKW